MQLYPEKYDKLELSSEEKSFLRTLDRAYSDNSMSYYVLHINPRRKDIGGGKPELFNLLISEKGIILFRIFDISDTTIAKLTLGSISNPVVFHTLLSDIQGRLEESQYLINSSGDLKYPFTICFVFPNIASLDSLSELNETDKVFAAKHVIFKDSISEIRKEGSQVVESYLGLGLQIEEERVNNILQRLCPEITIPRKYILDNDDSVEINDGKLVNSDRAVLSYRLDNRQIDIVNRIDKGHQLILACAGSGKSVLLISKCFKIASLNPNENFLITCYNRNLNNYYQWAIAQAGFVNKNVRCTTFFGLCHQLLEANNIPLPTMFHNQQEEYYNKLFTAADNALSSGKIKERFSGIFIDEVQIFKPEWYRFCFNLLKSKNPNEYFFIIAGDKSQDIKNNIRRGKAPWQGGGDQYPEYRGKTLPIEINYRNSKPINDAIDRYVSNAKKLGESLGVDLSSDPELFLRGTAYREGNPPTMVELTNYSNEGEATAICNAVKELIETKGLSEVDIAIILYNRRSEYTTKGWATHYYNLLPGIRSYFYKQGWENPAILISGESEGATYGSRRGVTIATIEGSLGLDFRAIVLAGLRPLGTHEKAHSLTDFYGATGEALIDKQEAYKKNINFIYTGCTRAKDELTIILSEPKGSSIYMDLLRESFGEEK